MIYYIQCTVVAPGTPLGQMSDLLVDLFTNRKEAETCFDDLIFDDSTICIELLVKEPDGKRKVLKTKRRGEQTDNG